MQAPQPQLSHQTSEVILVNQDGVDITNQLVMLYGNEHESVAEATENSPTY